MPLGLSLALVPVLILANAFFVAAEYAVVSVRPAQIAALRKTRRLRTAIAIEQLKADPTSAIGAIQVCITMTNLMLGWIGEPAMSSVLHILLGPVGKLIPQGVFIAFSTFLSFVVVTLLTVVLSELLPKALTLRYGLFAATLTARPTVWIQRAVWPLVWLMNHIANAVTIPLGLGRVDEMDDEPVTIAELRMLAERAAKTGTITAQGQSLVLNSLSLADRTAKDAMIHRSRVAYLDLKKTMAENREVMNAHLYSRLPLCDGGFDRVIGLVHTKEFLTAFAEEADSSVLQLIAKSPTFVPQGVSVDRLVGTFREFNTQLLFVADEFGSPQGIVTLDDVLDALLEEKSPTALDDSADGLPVSLPGETSVREIRSRFDLPEWAAETTATTLAGVIIAVTGRVPEPGEIVDAEGLQFRIEQSDARRIGRVALVAKLQSTVVES